MEAAFKRKKETDRAISCVLTSRVEGFHLSGENDLQRPHWNIHPAVSEFSEDVAEAAEQGRLQLWLGRKDKGLKQSS